jgi:hypothetical protein
MKHVARNADMQNAHKIYVEWGHCTATSQAYVRDTVRAKS